MYLRKWVVQKTYIYFMPRFADYFITLFVVLFLVCCTKKEEQVIGSPEEVLPGLWRIDSVKLTDYDKGVTFQGNTFFNDTILINVGTIQISPFSIDSLEALDLEQHRVECLLEMGAERMSVSLNSTFLIGADWFAAIRYNGPGGYQLIDTPIEEFYYSAHIFNNHYILEIVDNNTVTLWTSNDMENHVISLVRN